MEARHVERDGVQTQHWGSPEETVMRVSVRHESGRRAGRRVAGMTVSGRGMHKSIVLRETAREDKQDTRSSKVYVKRDRSTSLHGICFCASPYDRVVCLAGSRGRGRLPPKDGSGTASGCEDGCEDGMLQCFQTSDRRRAGVVGVTRRRRGGRSGWLRSQRGRPGLGAVGCRRCAAQLLKVGVSYGGCIRRKSRNGCMILTWRCQTEARSDTRSA